MIMADEPSHARAAPRSRSNARRAATRDDGPPLQFSLKSLGVFVTAICVLLGVAAVLGNWLTLLLVVLLALIFQVMVPVAVVTAVVYTKGYLRTFLLGVAVAILMLKLSSSRFLSSQLLQGRFELLTLLTDGMIVAGLVLSGAVAVAVRKAIESRGAGPLDSAERRDPGER